MISLPLISTHIWIIDKMEIYQSHEGPLDIRIIEHKVNKMPLISPNIWIISKIQIYQSHDSEFVVNIPSHHSKCLHHSLNLDSE